ncbi:MAG TPA: glycoside hydrolase family 3 N-terminal domain-containing protein [Luteibaculaceae bacterium]|nr:glycoside hydrolase family 3 N-terminal domain-containing protein [Luteibaculaceae bacterium]
MRLKSFTILIFVAFLAVFSAFSTDLRRKPKKKKKKAVPTVVTTKRDTSVKNEVPDYLEYRVESDPMAKKKYSWADSVFKTLTPRERLGQLFMVAAYSNKDESHFKQIDSLVSAYGLGGLIFMQGGPVRQAHLTNRWQKMARVPLMLAMDAEWGLAMRLDSVAKYPKQMTLGALANDSLIYAMGQQVAAQTKRLGMQVDFAPVADVNNNPNNPVINTRSFGEDKFRVTRKAIAYTRGLQDARVLATGKHFPGHGDTDTDSHHNLPTIAHPRERLDTLELYPFRKLFDAGLGSVMVAHLNIPALDTTTNLASTLSKKVVTQLLREELGFKGLVFTDALNMKGVASFYKPGQVDLLALLAGNDMLLFSEDVPTAMMYIDSAVMRGEIDQATIDERCLRVLKTKEWVGLNKNKPVETVGLVDDLNLPETQILNRQIRRESITLIKNNRALPLAIQKKTLFVSLGEEKLPLFFDQLSTYASGDFIGLGKAPSSYQQQRIIDTLRYYDQVVLALLNTNILARKNFGFTDEGVQLASKLAQTDKCHMVAFINPYALQRIDGLHRYQSISVAYQDDPETQIEAAAILAGALPARGTLPVSIDNIFVDGAGLSTKASEKIRSAVPEEVGIDSKKLMAIDQIVEEALKAEAFPGCQVMALKNGGIFYQKSFGYQQYKSKENPNPTAVSQQTVYDLASLTKVLSTTLAVMHLTQNGKLDLEKTLGQYLPSIPAKHPHAQVRLKDVLLHQAGFPAFIPFYKDYIGNDSLRSKWFSSIQSEEFSVQVTPTLYTKKTLKDGVFESIWKAPHNPSQGYKYSDISFIYLKEVVEAVSQTSLDSYVDQHFYQPMGLSTIGYKPLSKHALGKIAPTEYDSDFRKQLVHGTVHDPGAALLGGVSGHAGLFGHSADVAAIMHMLVNQGKYNGVQLLKPEIIELFTSAPNAPVNRRGLGFDKPTPSGSNGPTFDGISVASFGHSGFTGTFAWADPTTKMVYVFLSNRVYPTADNNKLVKMGVRSKIHEAIYKALK